MDAMRHDSERRNVVFGGVALALLGVAGCAPGRGGGGAGPAGGNGSLVTAGQRVALRCYEWTVRNTDAERRNLTDVHVPFQGNVTPLLPSFPPGWGLGSAPGGGLVFVTPPPTTGASTPQPQPIPAGGVKGPFRFCLKGTGPVLSGPIDFSFESGPNGPLGDVFQGGRLVPTAPDGTRHIKPTDTAWCRKLSLTAPAGQAVHDVHLERIAGGNPTGFLGVEPPAGWTSNPVDPGIVTIFPRGTNPPLAPGATVSFKVCFNSPNCRFHWRMTDAENRTIPGAEGTLAV